LKEKETCTKVWATSTKSKTVWMDDIMAKNAGINFGKTVSVTPVTPKAAEFVGLVASYHHTWAYQICRPKSKNIYHGFPPTHNLISIQTTPHLK